MCRLVYNFGRFERTCCCHVQGSPRRINVYSIIPFKKREVKLSLLNLPYLDVSRILSLLLTATSFAVRTLNLETLVVTGVL
jgi:hypothetical protein